MLELKEINQERALYTVYTQYTLSVYSEILIT